MHANVLQRELTHHQYLRERLEADFPDADEECLRDTLEGLTNLTDLLAEVLRSRSRIRRSARPCARASEICRRGSPGSRSGAARNAIWCAR